MSPENQNLEPEIAHILSIDVVGYSKLLVNEQIDLLDGLKRVVRETKCSCTAEAGGRLIRLPTGDGMVLLFFRTPEEPLQCAVEISEALKAHPHIQVRMGAHSGPVNMIEDVNDRLNVAGSGLNVVQRVMDCGDAGHILLSQHLAEDLVEYSHWRPHLHDLGDCIVKHGLRVHLVNFHNGSIGNPARPLRLQEAKRSSEVSRKAATSRRRYLWLGGLVIFSLLAALVSFFLMRALPGNTPHISEKGVAVLPFENWSAGPKDSYFADGVQGEILTLLTKVADLKVISRTSVMKYRNLTGLDLKEIGEALGVRYLLEGSVQRDGSRVRVTAQLVDSLSDAQVWAARYDRNLADVFKIQSEIAEEIVAQLRSKFTPEEKARVEVRPTADLVAYELYLRAKTMISQVASETSGLENLNDAAELLEQATARDPSFYLAYCQLASAHDQLYFFGIDTTALRLALAQSAVDAAIRLQPEAGETHLASATHYYFGYRDYDRALKELALAQRKLPNDPLPILLVGYIHRRQGHWKSSTEYLERAVELDPRNLAFLKQLAQSYDALRRYGDLREVLDRALGIAPGDPTLRVERAMVEFDSHGVTQPGHEAIETVLAKDSTAGSLIGFRWFQAALCEGDADSASRALAAMKSSGIYEEGVPYPKSWGEGLVARLRNDPKAARAAFAAARQEIARMVDNEPNFAEGLSALGMVDAALGDKDNAIREGKRAVELLPPGKDAIVGPLLLQNLATIHAWTGESAAALQELKEVATMPSYLNYGLLLRHPFWSTLHAEPGFKEILSSLAPATP